MDRASLQECRRLLRLVECEVVTDASDQNLFNILIGNEDKKIALLKWIIEHLYSPESCKLSSFDDLVGLFMSNNELKNFLKGNLPKTEQFELWKLMLNTLNDKKISRLPPTNETVLDKMLRGDLVNDSEIVALGKKTDTPSYVALVSHKKSSSELKAQIKEAEDKLTQINRVSDTDLNFLEDPTDQEKNIDGTRKFIDASKSLTQKLDELINNATIVVNKEHNHEFTKDQLNNQLLDLTRTNLSGLQEVMNSNIWKELTK